MNNTRLTEANTSPPSTLAHHNNNRVERVPYQALAEKDMWYNLGRGLRFMWTEISSYLTGFSGLFYSQSPFYHLNYHKLHEAQMVSYKEHLSFIGHQPANIIAATFKIRVKRLLPFQKKDLSRALSDMYEILEHHYRKDPQKLHDIVMKVPDIKKNYREVQKEIHNAKMQNFAEEFKREFPKHKTYDVTADYLKSFLKTMTPYEQDHKEKVCKEVLAILKTEVRVHAKDCDNDNYRHCAYEVAKYTARVFELNELHQPSSYGYIGWSQTGLKKTTKEKDIDLALIDKLYPSKVKLIFGREKEGVKAIASLPVLDLGSDNRRNYIDFIDPKDMTAPVMRGVDEHGRPFVAFCYKKQDGHEVVETLFQRYGKEAPLNWASGTHGNPYQLIYKNGRQGLTDNDINWARRLVKGEPCGMRTIYRDKEAVNLKVDSMFKLCDRKLTM